MKLRANSYVYIIIILLMLFVVLWSLLRMESFESKLLPLLFGSIVFILAVIGLGNEILAGGKPKTTATESQASKREETGERWGGYLANGSWLAGFILGIYLLGFIIAIPLFVLSYMKWLGTRWITAIIWSIVSPAIIYGVFEVALDVDLYRGLLLTWLGS